MKRFFETVSGMRDFLVLHLTQALSALGSAMTNFALIVWSYQAEGSALVTALLSVCSYAPYVVMSMFAGALSDRWDKKRTMLACDGFAAACTVAVLALLKTGRLEIWHLYVLNALNGLMNTVQQPAGDVAVTLLTPKKYFQQASAVKSFTGSVVNILTPMLATALLTLTSIEVVIAVDLISFAIAFVSLLCFVKIPEVKTEKAQEKMLRAVADGLKWLKQNRGIFDMMMFLAVINLFASVYNAALPAMMLSQRGGGETALGVINTVTGVAMVLGSVVASVWPEPKSRVRVICNTLLISMSTENFFLAFGGSLPVWCIGAVLGWMVIPLMNANLDVVFRTRIPVEMQGRVYSARNTFQFFTIPIGYMLGGVLVDEVFEPFMAMQKAGSIFVKMFGNVKGSGAAMLFAVIAVLGMLSCLIFRKDPHIWELEK